jgi:2-haloacid dehalogenase
MDKVRKGELPWTNLDGLHRMLLEDLLKEFRIERLSEEEKENWNHVWHRLKPWPDSVASMQQILGEPAFSKSQDAVVAVANALRNSTSKRTGSRVDCSEA